MRKWHRKEIENLESCDSTNIVYPKIYGFKTPEKHIIDRSPTIEAIYREWYRVGKLHDHAILDKALRDLL